jgi:putative ribosome biogenesis GTPase RsgA
METNAGENNSPVKGDHKLDYFRLI